MEELNKYKISYMDKEINKEEIIEAKTEKEATDTFLDKHPGLTIIYTSLIAEKEDAKNVKKVEEPIKDEIIGMNLKEIKKKEKETENEKKKVIEKVINNNNKKFIDDKNILILCFKIFLCIVGMTLLIYPIFGLAKLFDNDLYKAVVKSDSFSKDVTIFYFCYVIATLIGFIGLIVQISFMHYKGEWKRSLSSRIGSLVAGFVLFTMTILIYSKISFSEKTMLLVDYYGFKCFIVSLVILGIVSFTSEFGLNKASNNN